MFVLPDVDHVETEQKCDIDLAVLFFFFIVDLVQVINYTELCEWW